jgi:DNA-binding HxlR family transcriptional regulator
MRRSVFAKNDTVSAPVPLAECALAQAISVLGDGWTLLILREALFGVSSFDDMHADLGIPRAMLSGRLKALVAAGLLEQRLERRVGQRAYNRYHLTDKGRDLMPALIALRDWGARHLLEVPARVAYHHAECGGRIRSVLRCECGAIVEDGQQVVMHLDGAPRKPIV